MMPVLIAVMLNPTPMLLRRVTPCHVDGCANDVSHRHEMVMTKMMGDGDGYGNGVEIVMIVLALVAKMVMTTTTTTTVVRMRRNCMVFLFLVVATEPHYSALFVYSAWCLAETNSTRT